MGAYLSAPVTEKKAFDGETTIVKYGGSAMQGWRRNMEDAHFVHPSIKDINPEISIFGVFDGHGGCEVARFCEKYLPVEFSSTEGFPDDMELALSKIFHRMDEMLKDECYRSELEEMRLSGETNGDYEQDSEDPDSNTPGEAFLKQLDLVRKLIFNGNNNSNENSGTSDLSENPTTTTTGSTAITNSGSGTPPISSSNNNQEGDSRDVTASPVGMVQAGTTAIVAVLRGKELFIANAGDSRGVLCKGAKAVALSQDHKPGLDSERLRIEAAGGFLSDIAGMYRVNGNLNLSRAIGDLRYKSNSQLHPKDQIITAEPDVTKVVVSKEDKFFVLACDGVWDVMDNQQVVDFVLKGLEKGQLISDIASSLLDSCLAEDPKTTRGVGCDNMTCLIASFVQETNLEENHNPTSEQP